MSEVSIYRENISSGFLCEGKSWEPLFFSIDILWRWIFQNLRGPRTALRILFFFSLARIPASSCIRRRIDLSFPFQNHADVGTPHLIDIKRDKPIPRPFLTPKAAFLLVKPVVFTHTPSGLGRAHAPSRLSAIMSF